MLQPWITVIVIINISISPQVIVQVNVSM